MRIIITIENATLEIRKVITKALDDAGLSHDRGHYFPDNETDILVHDPEKKEDS